MSATEARGAVEDLAQEALAEALVSWSVQGVPDRPTGWLLTDAG